jgi:hypothetical protein
MLRDAAGRTRRTTSPNDGSIALVPSSNVDERGRREHHVGTSLEWMAASRIDDLHVDTKTGRPHHHTRHPRRFLPLEVRAWSKAETLLAARMVDILR